MKFQLADLELELIQGDIASQYVIHTLGPVYVRDKPEAALLEKCYQNSLKLAEESGIIEL